MNFDALAPHYRWIEGVSAGNLLQRCRTVFLDEIRPPKRILIVGEGNGRFLVEFCRRWGEAEVVCVDSSLRMLELARRRVLRAGLSVGRIEFIHADAREWAAPKGEFDLIVTHFFLDCFPTAQLKRIIGSLAAAAAPDAEWLLADFQIPVAGWRRLRARLIVGGLYLFFRAATRLAANALVSPDALLEQSRFRLRARRVTDAGLLRSDRWARNANGGLFAEQEIDEHVGGSRDTHVHQVMS